MNKPRHKGARETRLCIFCGENANSKEHFWPTWLHPVFTKPNPGDKHTRQAYQFHPSTGERISGPAARPGSVQTIQIRAVCKGCNNGWMSRLEGEARAVVGALAQGEAISLHEADLYLLAKWITLKCLVAEHNVPSTALTPQADRTAFMLEGAIPDYFHIYVALNVSGSETGYLRNSHCIALTREGPNPPLEGTSQNAQTISFLMGKAFIHVNAFRLHNFDFEQKSNIIPVWDTCRIWPFQAVPFIWPRRPALDSRGIRTVSEALERYVRSSNVVWA